MFRLTKAGVAELQTELTELIAKRTSIAESIKSARELGDLTENAEYQAARSDQERNEARIAELENILQNAEVIKEPSDVKKVQLGSKVKVSNGLVKQFQIVGTVEADPLNNKISDESPIGKALLGKKVGDKVEIKTPQEVVYYVISEIA